MKEIENVFGINFNNELCDLIPSQIWYPPRDLIFWDTSEIIRINFWSIETQTKEEINEDED